MTDMSEIPEPVLIQLGEGILDALVAAPTLLDYYAPRDPAAPVPPGAVTLHIGRIPERTPSLALSLYGLGEVDGVPLMGVQWHMRGRDERLNAAMVDDVWSVFQMRPSGTLGGVPVGNTWHTSSAELPGDGERRDRTENYSMQVHRTTPHLGDN